MNKNIKTTVVLLAFLISIATILSACGGGTAATYKGGKVSEKEVTARIEVVRGQNKEFKSDEGWATALKGAGLTPESYRKQIIESIIRENLIVKAAKDKGLKADTKAIDDRIKQMKDNKSLDQTMSSYGVKTEEDLKTAFESQELSSKLMDKLYPLKEVTGKELEDYVVQNAASFAGRKSSEIVLTPAEGKDLAALKKDAAGIKSKIKNAEDFAKYAKDLSKDSSAENGGDKGWSYQNSFPQAYTDALNKLKVGEVSAPLEIDNTVVLIMCTGIFEVPKSGTVAYKDVPKDIVDSLAQRASDQNRQSAYSDYVANLIKKADIKINKMPKNLSYNVDMKLAKAS